MTDGNAYTIDADAWRLELMWAMCDVPDAGQEFLMPSVVKREVQPTSREEFAHWSKATA